MKLAKWLETTKVPAAELARQCGVHPITIYKWRSGENFPRAAQLAAIVEATKGAVTADDFLTESAAVRPGLAEAQAPFVHEARALGLDADAIAAAALKKAIGDEKARRWGEENREAIAAHARYVEEHGLPLAKYRMF